MGTSGKNSAYFFFYFNHYKLLWRETKVLHSALMFTGVLNLDWYWLSPPSAFPTVDQSTGGVIRSRSDLRPGLHMPGLASGGTQLKQ